MKIGVIGAGKVSGGLGALTNLAARRNDLRGFIKATGVPRRNRSTRKDPMSIKKQTTSAKKAQADTPEENVVVSLIDLAANLDDPVHHLPIGKLSIVLEELKSINATRTQQLRGNLALRRYIE